MRSSEDALLVERDGLLDALGQHLAQAADGRGRLLLLHGEAGVGKTSVIGRFTGLVEARVQVLRGWCDPLSTPRPLGPWLDIAPQLRLTVQDEPGGVSVLLRNVLTALADGGPRLLVFEDVHWADAATLDLLRLLARRVDGIPVLLIASYRDDEIGPAHPLRVLLGDLSGHASVHRLAVEPLSPEGVSQLASESRLDAAELYRITGGNPFFVREVLAVGTGGVPLTVADVVAGRMARLSPSARDVAEMAAVLGSPVPIRLLNDLVGDAEERIGELLAGGLLQPEGTGVGFRHELTRKAVLDGLPTFRQRALHRQVLEQMRADHKAEPDFVLLAHHAEAAGDAAAVLEYAPAAAAAAARAGAHREAAAQFTRALRFGDSLPAAHRATMLERLAESSILSGQRDEGLIAIREAVDLRASLGDRLREGTALRLLSWLLWPGGRSSEAREVGWRAVQILESLPPSPELAWAYVNVCQISAYEQRPVAEVLRLADRAIDLAQQMDETEAAAQARFHLALARYGNVDHDAELRADLLTICRDAMEAGLPEAAGLMAMMIVAWGTVHRDHDLVADATRILNILGEDRTS